MRGLREEVLQIPARAEECYQKNKNLLLPRNISYLGMGSSYYAPLTAFYAGAQIAPHIASEYYYYLSNEKKQSAVLLSQSGESSETLWCRERFQTYIAVTNTVKSSLATGENIERVVQLYAGEELFSSTKTYINTLIVLYLGLGLRPEKAIQELQMKFQEYDDAAQEQAERIVHYMKKSTAKGFYVIGSGPNSGTAYEAALTLSETTKLSWNAMPVAQYDHGSKEAANNTVVLVLNSHGKDSKRIEAVKSILRERSNALVVEIGEDQLPEALSSLTLIAKANLLTSALAGALAVGETFELGGKVTEVADDVR